MQHTSALYSKSTKTNIGKPHLVNKYTFPANA